MAEETLGQSRTEAPTQRRRDEARQRGQVAVSGELTNGVQLLVGVAGLLWGARRLAGALLDATRFDLSGMHQLQPEPRQVQALLASILSQGVGIAGFFVGLLFVTGVAVSTLQVGLHLSAESVSPRWDRLSPAAGWSRIVSAAGAMRGLMSFLKAGVVAAVAFWVLKGRTGEIASLAEGSLAVALAHSWDITSRLALAIAAALVVIGLADYTFQRIRHQQSLMMTRQELREELKREEGDPMIRARVRKVARELARKRMMEDVPRATVVITNPTHLAVALRYERGVTPAPRVVAKGAGLIAQRIVTLARNHAVPVVERKPLAQALYKSIKVGQEIPAVLYYAVAEVLAYVYRLRGAA